MMMMMMMMMMMISLNNPKNPKGQIWGEVVLFMGLSDILTQTSKRGGYFND